MPPAFSQKTNDIVEVYMLREKLKTIPWFHFMERSTLKAEIQEKSILNIQKYLPDELLFLTKKMDKEV